MFAVSASLLGVLSIAVLPASTSIMLPELMTSFGAAPEELSALFLGNSLLAVFAILSAAFLADRFGYATVLTGLLAGASLAILIALFELSLKVTIAAHVAAGMFSAAALPVAMALIFYSVSVHWRCSSIALVLACPVVALPLVVTLMDVGITRTAITAGSAVAAASAAALVAFERRRTPPHVRRHRPQVFDGRLVWLISGAALLAAIVGALPASLALLLTQVHNSFHEVIRSSGHIFLYPVLGVLGGLLVGGIAADLLGRDTGRPDVRIGAAGGALAAVAAIFSTRLDDIELLYAGAAVIAFGISATGTLAHGAVLNLAARQFAVAAAAVVSTAIVIGMTAGSAFASFTFVGLSHTRTPGGALDLVFLGLSAAGVLAAALFLLAGRVERPEALRIEGRRPIPPGKASAFALGTSASAQPEHVKNGFSWPAFLFGPIWALTKGMAARAGLLLAGNLFFVALFYSGPVLYSFTGDVSGAAQLTPLAIVGQFLWFIWIGARGNAWRRQHLIRQGYEEVHADDERE